MKVSDIDRTLGHTFARMLETPALVIGKTVYTRRELVSEIGVANLVAATRLSQTLKQLGIRTVEQLAKLDPISLYKVHGTGHTQVYVAMCLLARHGINPVEWWGWEVKGSALVNRARAVKKRRGADEVKTAAGTTTEARK